MKALRWVILGTLASIMIVVVSYFWATNLMDSLYAFRSPFASQPPQAGQPIGPALSRRVVVILVDALRADTAANKEVMPFLNSLRARGASAVTHSGVPSYSAPSWSVLAIGAWPELSDGPAMNPTLPENYRIWTQDNIYTVIHQAGLHTAIAAHQYFKYMIPPLALDASAWTSEESPAADQQNIDAAQAFIQSGKYDYIFTYIDQVDYAGHKEGGPQDARWNAAATRADHLIEQIVGTLDLTQDTVLIYSDHGQIAAGGHGGQDAVVLVQPFIMVGANVRPGVYADMKQVDIAATTAVLLGAGIPAISQGRPQTEMLSLTPDQLTLVRQALNTQQREFYQSYAKMMAVPAAQFKLAEDQDPVAVYQAALLAIKTARLNRDRLPRFVIITLLVLIALYFLARQPVRRLGWFGLAALVYLAVFHVQYALINGGTFTLSTVLSASNLTTSTATYAAVAFFAAWLVILLALRLFSLPRLQAVHLFLGFAFSLMLLVSLPALWSLAYNGALVGWTLPDIGSMFFGFIFTLQSLVVAAVTLPLMAVTALVARSVHPASSASRCA